MSPLIQDREEAINNLAWWQIPHLLSGLSKFHEEGNTNLISDLQRIKPGAKTLGFVFKMMEYFNRIIVGNTSTNNGEQQPFNNQQFVIDGIIEYLELLDQIDRTLMFTNNSTTHLKFAEVDMCYKIYNLLCKLLFILAKLINIYLLINIMH